MRVKWLRTSKFFEWLPMTSTPIALPDLGAGSLATRVSMWLADIGETVHAGDRLVEVLLPGMTFDVASPATGRLARIERFIDAVVRPGDVLGWIEPAEADEVE